MSADFSIIFPLGRARGAFDSRTPSHLVAARSVLSGHVGTGFASLGGRAKCAERSRHFGKSRAASAPRHEARSKCGTPAQIRDADARAKCGETSRVVFAVPDERVLG